MIHSFQFILIQHTVELCNKKKKNILVRNVALKLHRTAEKQSKQERLIKYLCETMNKHETAAYLTSFDILTDKGLVVHGEFRRIVIHVTHFDKHRHSGLQGST